MSNATLVTAVTGSQQTRAVVNNVKGVSTLLYACQQGDVKKVQQILRVQPTAYFERDRTGKSALHYCCTSGHISAAQAADILVMAAPDLVESRDEDGFTPLHLAVIAGNMPLVTFLLANNADINAVDNEKHTVVHWATVCGEIVALRAVLSAGAPISTPDVHGGYPLHYAAQMCGGEKDSALGLQVLHTLLSHEDVNVLVEDGDGRPPLLWAASAGSAKAVLALIRAGTPIEAHDKDGLTALHCAASRGHTDCIDTLLTLCGASPDIIDSNGCTALHYAVTLGHADATALLLSHTADFNRQDRKGRSPAHCGCAKGQFETVKMLGAHGANLWLRNARGDLPLHEAASSGRRDLVRWLLEARPSQVNSRNNDGRCPLHLAALNDNADMCKILIDAGAQINPILRTSKNLFMTPMDCALQRGFRSTAKYLQLHGGLPANRLSMAPDRVSSSAVSLHIRDDVTLWGGSSSEGENEDDTKKKSKKKVYKRKSAYKFDKKKEVNLVKEVDPSTSNIKFLKPDLDENQKENANRQGEIFIYANEVNISDKLGGITIKQNSEIVMSESGEMVKQIKTNSTEKRPKSAKHGRFKNTTPASEDNNLDTSSTTAEKEIITETKVEIDAEKKETVVSSNESLTKIEQDRESVKSNTSLEDLEDHTNVVVEVSVHDPPKESSVINATKDETVNSDGDIKAVVQENVDENIITETVTHKAEEAKPTADSNNESSSILTPPIVEEKQSELVNTSESLIIQEQANKNNVNDINKEIKDIENLPNQIDVTIVSKKELDDTIKKTKPEGNSTVTPEQQDLTTVDHKSKSNKFVKTNEQKLAQIQSDESSLEESPITNSTEKHHQSFKVLNDDECVNNKPSVSTKIPKFIDDKYEKLRRSKIPTPINLKTPLSKSDKYLERYEKQDYPGIDVRVPSLPNIYDPKDTTVRHQRSISNLSAPLASTYSDNDRETGSDVEDVCSETRKKKLRKRSKTRNAKSAGSDYESSNIIDSGFEPSPRSTRLPKSKHITTRGVNMTSVTQTIQSNIRRYHLERKIFQHLLDLKRLQIRSGQHNEAVLVKRAIHAYHRSCAATVGAGRYLSQDYTFKNFERFLYNSLRKIQKNGSEHLQGFPETPRNPLLCTQSTHRCDHATHAYTGVPCAAYLPKMDHHSIPKIGFDCKPSGFLPKILPKNAVTLELCHGNDKQVISLPAERLDQNKRYYVTFTVKGTENNGNTNGKITSNHLHSKSD
ncbi:hypothetical protein FQR65_LT03156 [Abscondita terminalis]|nr:hypothetical protein FQR65_LT03156 [Abscondita terminalis]